jgi:hypothetical protein
MIQRRRSISLSNALFPRLCRGCGKSSAEVTFAKLSLHRCTACVRDLKQERQARILARGGRVTITGEISSDGLNPKHLKWIKRLPCAVRRSGCSRIMHSHHVRTGGTGGTAMKPPDRLTVPLCETHHVEFDIIGVDTFEAKYSIDLKTLAGKLAALSPHLRGSAP